MTYPIATVIYGCPYPQGHPKGDEFETVLEEHYGEDGRYGLEEEEDSLWVGTYSASPDMDPAGYFGHVLHEADGYWELQPGWFQEPIAHEVATRVDTVWEALPEPVRAVLGRPRLAIAWSDS